MIREHESERGAAALLVAFSLVLLLGVAAIAVDGGSAFSERRQLQGAVDAGVLSAGLAARADQPQAGCATSGSLSQTAACNGAMVAVDIINASVDSPFTLSQFADAGRCTDAAFGGDYVGGIVPQTAAGLNLSCIRFSPRMQKIKIILPVESVETTFGRVLGRNAIDVSAVAEAELDYKRPGQVIPFALGPTGAGLSHACMFEPAGGNAVPPCDGPASGNFGYLGPQLFGDDELGTPTICNNASNEDRIAASFAKGSDHYYAATAVVPGTANDRAECNNKNQPIDNVDVQTGGSTNAIVAGAFDGIWGTEGRLLCKDGMSPTGQGEPSWFEPALDSQNSSDPDCVAVSNNRLPSDLDNTPIWEFFSASNIAESVSDACKPSNQIDTKGEVETCLTAWRGWPTLGRDGVALTGDEPVSGEHSEILFTEAIAESPRFAWVPLLNTDPATGGSGFYDIVDFVPIYIQTLQWKCVSGTCDVTFDPGEPCTGCGFTQNKSFDGMTAFILTRDMLPESIRNFPDDQGQRQYNLSE